jgi:hypothetical protein
MSRGADIAGVEKDGFVRHNDDSLGQQIVELETNLGLSIRF